MTDDGEVQVVGYQALNSAVVVQWSGYRVVGYQAAGTQASHTRFLFPAAARR